MPGCFRCRWGVSWLDSISGRGQEPSPREKKKKRKEEGRWSKREEEAPWVDIRELGELCISGVPHAHRVGIVTDQLFQVSRERLAVNLGGSAVGANTFTDLKNDACEAILVDIDLLVVGDLAQFATYLLASGTCRHA